MAEPAPLALRVSCDPVEVERVLVRFLRDVLESSGLKGYVVGMSGGIDSAVSGALAARAVGAEKVHALALPDSATGTDHLEDAAEVCRALGVRSRTQSIQPLVDAFQAAVPEASRAALANAKARLRMILLHAEAMRRNALVLGTGNKSELMVGYFTKYGDGGVDVQPLGDLYKTQVRQLADHLGLPPRVRSKPPTAGLWEGQTDEGELGLPYERLDRMLLGLELNLAPAAIAVAVGCLPEEVARVDGLRRRTQHKRRMPLIPKIGIRTVGLDWRLSSMEG